MLKSSNGKSRQSGRRSVNDKVYDEAWDEVWYPRKGRAFHQPPRIVKSRTRTTTRTRTKPRKGRTKPRKGRAFPQPSVSHGPRTLPVLLLLSMPRHTSSLSSSHTLSSTLRRKTLSRLLSASPISTQKGLSCPCNIRYPASQPIPITSRPIPFSPTNPEAPYNCWRLGCEGKRVFCYTSPIVQGRTDRERLDSYATTRNAAAFVEINSTGHVTFSSLSGIQ
jgi:hypothetical protein